jgi:hypothetical protein
MPHRLSPEQQQQNLQRSLAEYAQEDQRQRRCSSWRSYLDDGSGLPSSILRSRSGFLESCDDAPTWLSSSPPVYQRARRRYHRAHLPAGEPRREPAPYCWKRGPRRVYGLSSQVQLSLGQRAWACHTGSELIPDVFQQGNEHTKILARIIHVILTTCIDATNYVDSSSSMAVSYAF